MAKTTKSTKKFQRKHLKGELERRKDFQKRKQKIQSRRGKSNNKGGTHDVKNDAQENEVFDDMPVDEFLEKGFEVPQKKEERTPQSEEESSSSEDEETMQQDLNNLKEKDPEFYKYLENNDKDLLDFEGLNPLDEIEDGSDQVENDAEAKGGLNEIDSTSGSGEILHITSQVVDSWASQLQSPSIKVLKNISLAFKAAVNINKVGEEDYKYKITDPEAFNGLMMIALNKLPEAVQSLVKYKKDPNTGARIVPESKKATQITNILKSMGSSYVTLLQDTTNSETAALVLSSILVVLPFYISQRKVLKHILVAATELWSSSPKIDIQIASFAFLNNAVKEYPSSLLEIVLRSTYASFLKNSRMTNIHTMPQLNFCKNSVAELFGLNESLSYQIGFEYIRQLAIHLRNSISATSKAKEGYKTVYNWQFCHSLDFWSRVIARQSNPEIESQRNKSKESPLRQLIYPLVQVTLGTIRLIPSPQFFPLRFYLIRSLIRLSQSSGVYIPLFPLLGELLNSTTLTKKPKAANLAAFDFDHEIRANQAYLDSKVYQDGVCEQFVELVGEFFVLHCKSIAFPELVTPAIITLRRFIKSSPNARLNKQLQQVIEKLNSNADFISKKRSNVDYGPLNKREVQLFLKDVEWENTPLGKYIVVQRQLKESKQRAIRESIVEDENSQNAKDNEESDVELEDVKSASEDEASSEEASDNE